VPRLVLVERVRPSVLELVERQGDRAAAVERIRREELFLLEHSVVVPAGFEAAARAAARSWLSDSWELVHPFGSGGVYATFRFGPTRRATRLLGCQPRARAAGEA
jgi:hypothetical protein